MSVPDHVAFRRLAHETILLNVTSGQYHSVDSIGTRFFEALQAATVEQAAATLAAEYAQPLSVMQTDVLEFCDQLVELGLIELDSG